MLRSRLLRLSLLFVAWIAAAIPAARALVAPPGGVSLVNVTDVAVFGAFRGGGTPGAPVAVRTIVPVTGQPFAQAARIDVQRPSGQFWDSAIAASSNRAVAKGDVVLLHFYLRAVATTDETGSVTCQVYVEGPAPNYSKSLSQGVSANSAWTEYFLPFVADGDYPSGQFTLNFGFGAGARPQTLELAGAEMIWYGTSKTLADMPRTSFQYEGRAADAAWRAEAARRIETHRKGNYEVRVVNSAGVPVPGATVQVKLKRHRFQFGCSWDAARIVDQTTADNRTYRTKLLELFNAGSTGNDLKWPPWIGEWGSSYSRNQTLAALAWMKANSGFALRGHVLVWPGLSNLPNFIKPLVTANDPSVPQKVIDHIADIVPATKEYLPEWDVLNEPYDNHDLMDRYGRGVMVDWFKEARKHHPTAKLYINDYAIISGGGLNVAKQDAYAATIRYLLDNGAPVDGVGFQGHFDGSPTGVAKAWSIMERYANEFPGVEFKITEFDVDTDDEQLQADYTRDFLTLVFSHPRFSGFQVWGYWESAHWKPRAAMYRKDWTEKPNGAAWRELVVNTWRTDETRQTAADGRVRGRGFYGDYEVTVTLGGKTQTGTLALTPGAAVATVTIDTPLDGAPQITRQPLGATVAPGGTVQLEFEAAGAPAPSLTWYRNGAVFATGARLSLPNLQVGSDAEYFAEATNAAGTARTRTVRVAVRPAGTGTSKLFAISTRGKVYAGSKIMIAGFAITGSGSKPLIIRGVGPMLAQLNIPNFLPDPMLALFPLGSGSPSLTNDDWDPAIAPEFDKVWLQGLGDDRRSAAFLTAFDPGVYTVQLSGKNNGNGVGIIEVYDTAWNQSPDLIALSTRGEVGTDGDMMIAGFVILGSEPKKLLLRGVGPQLKPSGLSDYLADPVITLFEYASGGARKIAENDDWCVGNDLAVVDAAARASGAASFEPYSRDAALLVELEPGSYTLQVAGANRGTGVALVEVYTVP